MVPSIPVQKTTYLIELLLQFLIRVVNAELLEAIHIECFEAEIKESPFIVRHWCLKANVHEKITAFHTQLIIGTHKFPCLICKKYTFK